MSLSLLYYEAQRSGPLPANNRIPWRRDANVDDPVPGGWYDGECGNSRVESSRVESRQACMNILLVGGCGFEWVGKQQQRLHVLID